MVLAVGGVILRYWRFYGPGTYRRRPPPPPKVYIDAVIRRTVDAVDHPSGIITILALVTHSAVHVPQELLDQCPEPAGLFEVDVMPAAA